MDGWAKRSLTMTVASLALIVSGCSSSGSTTAGSSTSPPALTTPRNSSQEPATPASTTTSGVMLKYRNKDGNLSAQQFAKVALALNAAIATSPRISGYPLQIWQIGYSSFELRLQGATANTDTAGLQADVSAAATSQQLLLIAESVVTYSQIAGGAAVIAAVGEPGTIAFLPTPASDSRLDSDGTALAAAARKAGFAGWVVGHAGGQTYLAVVGSDAATQGSFLLALAAQPPYSSPRPNISVDTMSFLSSS